MVPIGRARGLRWQQLVLLLAGVQQTCAFQPLRAGPARLGARSSSWAGAGPGAAARYSQGFGLAATQSPTIGELARELTRNRTEGGYPTDVVEEAALWQLTKALAEETDLDANAVTLEELAEQAPIEQDAELFYPFEAEGSNYYGEDTAELTVLARLEQQNRMLKAEEGRSGWFYKALLVIVAVFWGTNFPAVRFIETFDVPSSSLAGLRFGIAGLAMAPALWGKPKELITTALECGVWAGVGYLAQAIGLEVAEANKAAFICSLHVVLVPFLSAVLGIEAVKARQWVAASLALVGVGLLEGTGSSAPGAADALLLLQPLGFGISYLRIEEAARRFPGEGLALSAGQLISVALVSFAWMGVDAFNGVNPAMGPIWESKAAIAAVLYTGLLTTALTIYLQTIALEKVSATDMTVIISTEPLVAAAVSVFALGESLSPLGILGGTIIFATCVWGNLAAAKEEEEAAKKLAASVGLQH